MIHIRVPQLFRTSYPVGENISNNLPLIQIMYEEIKKLHGVEGINLWCRGSSGAIIAAIIAKEYINSGGKALICHVKKKGEHSHNGSLYFEHGSKDIIVDDFVSSGETVKAIWAKQQEVTEKRPCHCLVVSCNLPVEVSAYFADKLEVIISN